MVVQAIVPVQSVIMPRGNAQAYLVNLLEQSQRQEEALERRLATALQDLAILTDTEMAKIDETLAEKAAEGAPDSETTNALRNQIRRQRAQRTRAIGDARRAVTLLQKRLSVIRRYHAALEAGYVPIPRLPALHLEYVTGLIPREALQAIIEAEGEKLFDEFRIVDGREATAGGHPRRRDLRPLRTRDPIIVGLISEEMFPIAWWR